MALRVQTNIAAINAQKQLNLSNSNLGKSLERLSSGFRINRAADDAAGLAIAGKLRANIKSYVKAAENTAQANSMVQVGEGAMDQIENIMNRLTELATQAGSANTDSTGRARLNDEFTALTSEINRIANATKYGDDQLLTGTFGAVVSSTSAGMSADVGISANSVVNVAGHANTGTVYTIEDGAGLGVTLSDGALTQTITLSATGAQTINFDNLGVKIALDSNYSTVTELDNMVFSVSNATQNIVVGNTNATYTKVALAMADMRTSGSDKYDCATGVSSWSANASSDAVNLLDSIDTAISFITEKRGDLGAIMNRLSYAAANLATTIENTSSAESTIRDVDMAAEMTAFTKSQILMQAGTAMLAQANMAPQQVLSLFG